MLRNFLISILLIALIFPIPTPALAADESANYTVTFQSTWSAQTHPTQFPAGAHFSPLIGATHAVSNTFWLTGTLASSGIESMAETGGTATLRNEFVAAGGNVLEILSGSGLPSPGSATIASFKVDRSHPAVTLVTMVAPSPDWFTGVSGLSLLDETGNWRDEMVVTLYPYDAGSDDGVTYTSADVEPAEHHPIANYQGIAPFSTEPIGMFTFKRVDRAKFVYLPVMISHKAQ